MPAKLKQLSGSAMRPRVAEIKAVTALLEQEWADVDELSQAVIETVYEALMSRDWWVVVADAGSLGLISYGPYENKNKAMKAIGKEIVSFGPEPLQGWVRTLQKGARE